jgi:hypothetical protein
MTAANNLVMLFLGIEALSIPLYVLVGSRKKSLAGNEAAIKYFLMGAFSTAVFLLGCAFIYGSTGAIDLYINDDGSRLYSRLVLYSTTTTIGSIQYNAQYSAYITGNADPSTTAFCQYEFSINSYANTTNQKVIQSKSWVRNQGTDMSVNTYESNAAVTSIRIHNSAANNFAAGSMFTLYGITKA